jgi:1-acylglycerone phosphate reductase
MSTKKTVLITGTSSGIGHSLARQLNDAGYTVLATARSKDAISDLSALGITALALDVESPESIKALKAEVETITGGSLDMLINNAGETKTKTKSHSSTHKIHPLLNTYI